jgi:hypothetical protein
MELRYADKLSMVLHLQKIEELCIDIVAHDRLDWSPTIAGNGVNCAEAFTVAAGIIKIMHGNFNIWQRENEHLIERRIEELREG